MRERSCDYRLGPEDDDDDEDLDATGVWQLPSPAELECADPGPAEEEG